MLRLAELVLVVLVFSATLRPTTSWTSRGPNQCPDVSTSPESYCCTGWSTQGSSRLCTKPLCKSDCGEGTCFRPSQCICSDGTVGPSCESAQNGGMAQGKPVVSDYYPAAVCRGQLCAKTPGGPDVIDDTPYILENSRELSSLVSQDSNFQEQPRVIESFFPCLSGNCNNFNQPQKAAFPDCFQTLCRSAQPSSSRIAVFDAPKKDTGVASDRDLSCSNCAISSWPSTQGDLHANLKPCPGSECISTGINGNIKFDMSNTSSQTDLSYRRRNKTSVTYGSLSPLLIGWSNDRALSNGKTKTSHRMPEGHPTSLLSPNEQSELHSSDGVFQDRATKYVVQHNSLLQEVGNVLADKTPREMESTAAQDSPASRSAVNYAISGRSNDVFVRAQMALHQNQRGMLTIQKKETGETYMVRNQPAFSATEGLSSAISFGIPVVAGLVFSADRPTTPLSNPVFAKLAPSPDDAGLSFGFISNGFSVGPVAVHSNKQLPIYGNNEMPSMPECQSDSAVGSACATAAENLKTSCGNSQCASCDECVDNVDYDRGEEQAGRLLGAPNLLCSPGYFPVQEENGVACELGGSPVPTSPCQKLPCHETTCNDCTEARGNIQLPDAGKFFGTADSEASAFGPLGPSVPLTVTVVDSSRVISKANDHRPCGAQSIGRCGNNASPHCGTNGCLRAGSCRFMESIGVRHPSCASDLTSTVDTDLEKCVNGVYSAKESSCVCHKGYWGEACEKDFDECSAGVHGCQHECVNTIGSYACVCQRGAAPSDNDNSCVVKICPECLHGGRCENGTCACPKGFHGNRCEKDINECTQGLHNCSQLCRNTFGSHECLCRQGFKLLSDKKTCEERKCKPACANGGECVKNKCVCPSAYVGVICQFEASKMQRT